MTEAVLHWLQPRPGQVLADGTLGGGGHTKVLVERVLPGGRIVAVDRDPRAVALAERTLRGLPISVAVADYGDLPEVLAEAHVERLEGVLLDLGLSTDQLADEARGFSFHVDGPLDLRFNPQLGEPAWRMLDRLSEKTLAKVIFEYGEERYSRRIARAICDTRRVQPIRTSGQLAKLIRECVPAKARHQRIDAATRTFQALRIMVNDELSSLEKALQRLPEVLVRGARSAKPSPNRAPC
jgi:16S rRNA (cytosine1402-N4)-methyltransferase